MTRARALVVGGTGATGQLVVAGLVERGYEVTILHRGTHEPPELLGVAHLHADPHFEAPLREALETRDFDVVLGMYGRAAIVSGVVRGRCDHYISISGAPVYAGYNSPGLTAPFGMAIGASEDGTLADAMSVAAELAPIGVSFARRILSTEQTVHANHPSATIFRYPMIYGRDNVIPWEWSVVRRVLDGRRWMILPDHGLSIHARCAAENAAHSILLGIDQPDLARGQIFNVADDQQFTLRQWVETLSTSVGRTLEIQSLPSELCAGWNDSLQPQAGDISPHTLVANVKIREVLGYRDVVEPPKALAAIARWLVHHPLNETGPAFLDRFDYAAEDRAVAAYRAFTAEFLASYPVERPEPFHAMPHPQAPGLTDERGR